jgi:hypothetical protein
MQRLFDALRGTLGSYLREAVHEGMDAVACLPVPHAHAFSSLLLLFGGLHCPFL